MQVIKKRKLQRLRRSNREAKKAVSKDGGDKDLLY